MNEDKQKICDLLLPALQATRNLHDLAALRYVKDEVRKREHVIAVFANGHIKTVNVHMDSGTAMIHDIIENIV